MLVDCQNEQLFFFFFNKVWCFCFCFFPITTSLSLPQFSGGIPHFTANGIHPQKLDVWSWNTFSSLGISKSLRKVDRVPKLFQLSLLPSAWFLVANLVSFLLWISPGGLETSSLGQLLSTLVLHSKHGPQIFPNSPQHS